VRQKSCQERRGGARPLTGIHGAERSGKISSGRIRQDTTENKLIFSAVFAEVEKRIGCSCFGEQIEQVPE